MLRQFQIVAGPAGPPGAGANWRGAWSSGATYAPYDAVSYNGSSYLALLANSNSAPDVNPTKWLLIASKGDPGSGGTAWSVTTRTGSYSVTTSDVVVIANGAGLTMTLPSAVLAGAGKFFFLKNGASGTTTTLASAAGTIDGGSTYTGLVDAYDAVTVVSDGADYFLF